MRRHTVHMYEGVQKIVKEGLKKQAAKQPHARYYHTSGRVFTAYTDGLIIGSQTSIGDLSHIIESTELEALE